MTRFHKGQLVRCIDARYALGVRRGQLRAVVDPDLESVVMVTRSGNDKACYMAYRFRPLTPAEAGALGWRTG